MPKRELNGAELAGFIQERQARQVRMLRQAHGIIPKLVVIKTTQSTGAIDAYIRMKQRYGDDILIQTEVVSCADADMTQHIQAANADESVHGILVQLPLADPTQTDDIVQAIAPAKDVDGLAAGDYPSATAEAINWLLGGYNVDLDHAHIVIVGHGRLVGAPLAEMWRASGYDVTVCDQSTPDLASTLAVASVIVAATGVPRLITSDMIPIEAVVVDAGTASENGALVGDVAEDARARDDLIITPLRGGVGPLTIAALYDHVIQAALARIPKHATPTTQ